MIMRVYMLSLVGGEAFRCHRGDEVMSSFDWRKKLHRQLNSTLNSIFTHSRFRWIFLFLKFAIKKGRRRSTKRQYLRVKPWSNVICQTSIYDTMENRRHVSKGGTFFAEVASWEVGLVNFIVIDYMTNKISFCSSYRIRLVPWLQIENLKCFTLIILSSS